MNMKFSPILTLQAQELYQCAYNVILDIFFEDLQFQVKPDFIRISSSDGRRKYRKKGQESARFFNAARASAPHSVKKDKAFRASLRLESRQAQLSHYQLIAKRKQK